MIKLKILRLYHPGLSRWGLIGIIGVFIREAGREEEKAMVTTEQRLE